MKILAIIQARVGSTRLPRKALKEINGQPSVYWVIERLKHAETIDQIVLATTDLPEDKALVDIAKENGIESYCGSEDDVLDRFYKAAKRYKGEIIVRITADCPLLDPKVIDKVVRFYLQNKDKYDYVSNTVSVSYPDGLDVEVFLFKTLEIAWKEARLASEREHVTAYILKNAGKFRLFNIKNEQDFSHLRWTLDNHEDLVFVQDVYSNLYKEGSMFYMHDILDLINRKPELLEINKHLQRNTGYAKSLREDRKIN